MPPFASITIDLDPVILRLGHLHVGWYGVAVAAGIVVSLWVANRDAQRRSLASGAVWTVGVWAVVGGFAGARALHVIDRWSTYSADPLRLFAVQQGGLAIEGALLGGVAAGVLAAWRNGIPILSLADAAAPGVILGQAIGRLGCLVTGDALGAPTSLPWGVSYSNPGSMAPALGVSYQPVFAYEALWDLGVFLLLWSIRGRLGRPGTLFASYLMLYSTGKFGLTFLRQERAWFFGLQEAHVLAVILFASGLCLAMYQLRRVPPAHAEPRARPILPGRFAP